MSTLNLDLKCVGLMHNKMYNSLANLRKVVVGNPDFTKVVTESVSPVKVICLELQSKKLSVLSTDSPGDIALFGESALTTDCTLEDSLGRYKKATLAQTFGSFSTTTVTQGIMLTPYSNVETVVALCADLLGLLLISSIDFSIYLT